MKVLTMCVFLLFAVAMASPQEHAPTKAQCDADFNLWSSNVISGASHEWALRNDSSTKVQDIINEVKEMGVCDSAYMPGDKRGTSQYADLAKTLDSLLETRLIAFMARHPEVLKQFLQEDAAGKR